jgi:Tfp pilus assembly protein PilZ
MYRERIMNTEKRKSNRRSCKGQVHVDATESGKHSYRYEGAMRDISINGVRLHGKHPIEIGAKLKLLIELEQNNSQYSLSGSVKWVTETTEHEFIAGLELQESNSKDILQWREQF